MVAFSSLSSAPLMWACAVLSLLLFPAFLTSAQSLIQLGYQLDPTAAGSLHLGTQAVLDLHCNPVQQFSSLPSNGGQLLSFATNYDPQATTVPGVCRMALYTVLANGSYELLAGTDASLGSDLPLIPGTGNGPVQVQNPGSLYYPYGGPVTLYPEQQYAVCFSNNGGLQYVNGTVVNGTGGVNGTIAMYHWPDSSAQHVQIPYDLNLSPLPNPIVDTATIVGVTWQIWMNVAVDGFVVTSSSSSSSAPAPSSSVSSSPRASSSVTSAVSVKGATSAAAVAGSGTVMEVGYKMCPTATGPLSEGGEAIFDLHCNPVQQFSDLPATGAELQNFVTNYDPRATTVRGVCRMALYQVSAAGNYSLVAATSTAGGSDIPLGPGKQNGPVQVSNPGRLYYPNGAASATLYPDQQYSICFINNGANSFVNGTVVNGTGTNGTIAQYHWQDSAANKVLIPYDINSPLPDPLTFSGTSLTTWQMWITVVVDATTSSTSSGASVGGDSGSSAGDSGSSAAGGAPVFGGSSVVQDSGSAWSGSSSSGSGGQQTSVTSSHGLGLPVHGLHPIHSGASASATLSSLAVLVVTITVLALTL